MVVLFLDYFHGIPLTKDGTGIIVYWFNMHDLESMAKRVASIQGLHNGWFHVIDLVDGHKNLCKHDLCAIHDASGFYVLSLYTRGH